MYQSPAVERMHKRYVLRVRLQRLANFALAVLVVLSWGPLPEPALFLAREATIVGAWALLSAVVARCPFCRGRFSWVWEATGHCTNCGF